MNWIPVIVLCIQFVSCMDIEYRDIRAITTFKAAAGQSVTRACVSSMHPVAEESSPVPRHSSSSHLTLSLWGCQPVTTALTVLRLHTEDTTCRNSNSIIPTWVTLKVKCKVRGIPQKWLFVIWNPESASQMCVQDIHNRAVPRWGFYGEIKENQEGYLQAQLTFQVRGWCWLQPANWRHIWEMSRCVPNGLSLNWESWCKIDPQWPDESWSHALLTVWNTANTWVEFKHRHIPTSSAALTLIIEV